MKIILFIWATCIMIWLGYLTERIDRTRVDCGLDAKIEDATRQLNFK